MWQVIKIHNKWCIYNTTTGTLLTKFNGKGTKEEAMQECKLRNNIQGARNE